MGALLRHGRFRQTRDCRKNQLGYRGSPQAICPRVLMLALVTLLLIASGAWAGKNAFGLWVLEYAGPHDRELHTCEYELEQCYFGDLQVNAPAGPGSFDLYIVAVDVGGIAGARFGLYGQGEFYFYDGGWSSCSVFEIPTEGWPGCGEGMAMAWPQEQAGPQVTLGVLHVYAYGEGRLWTGPDPRVGFAEWCDGSQPYVVCDKNYNDEMFSIVGFGSYGCDPCYSHGPGCATPGFDLELYGSCSPLPVHGKTWGAVKAFYR